MSKDGEELSKKNKIDNQKQDEKIKLNNIKDKEFHEILDAFIKVDKEDNKDGR